MTKVVNPINRTNDEMESKACGCKCVCNENIAPHGVGQAELGYHLFLVVVVFVVVIQTIRMQIATFIMLSRAKKGMLRGGVSFPF